jgi:AraC-like DNA-binding protein
MVRTRYAEGLSLEAVAAELRITASHLSRVFSRETGTTFVDYLSEVRITRACHLLDSAELSVKEVARECGYADANYFSRAFKRLRGCTPSEYAARSGRTDGAPGAADAEESA